MARAIPHIPTSACRRAALLFLIVVLFISGCQTRIQTTAAPVSVRLPTQTFTVGLCEDFPDYSRSITDADADLSFMNSLGVSVLRVALAWDSVELSRGIFEWTFWDELVAAAGRRNIRLIPYICYTPRWASSAPQSGDYWRNPPIDDADYARFVQAVATRYRGRIGSWELWNEPDNLDYWRGTPEQFAHLVTAGSRAVRAADPHAKVVLGGLSWNLEFLRNLLRDQHVGEAVDIINLHAYFETWIPGSIESISSEVNRAAELIDQYGTHQSIWLAEAGYSDFRRGAYVSADCSAHYAYEHTPDYQAQALLRIVTLAAQTNRVRLIAWYRINDLPSTQDVIGDMNNRHLGIRGVDGRPKPASIAIRLAAHFFSGQVRCIDEQVQTTRAFNGDAQIHVFKRFDGRCFVVSWLQTDGRGPSAPSVDHRQEDASLKLPGLYQSISVESAVGAPAVPPYIHRSAKDTNLRLHLAGDATVILELIPAS